MYITDLVWWGTCITGSGGHMMASEDMYVTNDISVLLSILLSILSYTFTYMYMTNDKHDGTPRFLTKEPVLDRNSDTMN